MPEITFDGRRITVEPGTNLVEAGLVAGVPVPVYCYQRDMGAVGACRVCAVTVTIQGKSRMVMGCMTQATDGMEVTTLDPQSREFRRWVSEWLMVNHPHDCPICDEGGECQLQDLTIATGHGIRRIPGPKRTFVNQYLGEFIAHEMNRCITCYRCVRFYQDYAGGRDFGASGSRDRVYFGRYEDGPLESPFSGNLVELCPTGVFTDKLFRYHSRVWDLEFSDSICPHCSVGCAVRPGSRHRDLERVRMRENRAVNGIFLCDRGQFGHGYVDDPARPREPRLRGRAASWEDALGAAGGALLATAREHGPQSVALVASERSSLETHAALRALASGPLAGARVAHFDDGARERRALAALAALARSGCPPLEQREIGACDVLLIAGASLVDEAPLAALAARQAARRGGRVFVWNVAERYLGDVATVTSVHPARLASRLRSLAGRWSAGGAGRDSGASAAGAGSADEDRANLDALAAALREARRPGLLFGADLLDGPAFTAAADLARALAAAGNLPNLGFLFPGPAGFAAGAFASMDGGAGSAALLDDLAAVRLRAALLVECDLDRLGARALDALRGLDTLVVLDHLAHPLLDEAHAALPIEVTYESHGIFVNREGRAQAFAPALHTGEPVRSLIDHARFPRQPRIAPPGSGSRPASWVLEQIRGWTGGSPAPRTLENLRRDLAASHPFWRGIETIAPGDAGVLLDPATLAPDAPALDAFESDRAGLSLFTRDRTLGSELLSRRSEPMRRMAGPPVVELAPGDARARGVDGRVELRIGAQAIETRARVVESLPAGVALAPRDLAWPEPVAQGAAVEVRAVASARDETGPDGRDGESRAETGAGS
ncbi:MAG TPA: 2Fe-2S iron-sulfur cluster-binding protein [Terriglobales bacterium]|nr:2Fe-2S iron-sulfur cluster-binding protein [Terriglobales bacterium]